MSTHKELHFPTQRPDEHVVMLLRRHWTVLGVHIGQLFVLLLVPPSVLTLLFLMTDFSINTDGLLYVTAVLGGSLYYLFVFLTYFNNFIDYHLDIWIITDQRIVSIEQHGLFKRTTSELNIIKVQDVTAEVSGKVQTFLDYGHVHIQTAGSQERSVFEEVPHPEEVAKVILQVHDRVVKMQEMEMVRESEQYRQEIGNTAVHKQPLQKKRPQQ